MSDTPDAIDLEKLKPQIKNFSDLLDRLNSIDDKKKQLWMEIYENAISDRHIAYAMYVELFRVCAGKGTDYAVHGRNIAAFIERMNKANDQLIKLAELVASAEKKEEDIDPERIFSDINRR